MGKGLQEEQTFQHIDTFDGQDLKQALLAGAGQLEENREAINALNVFPVPDGDTGSNMSATMQAAIRDIRSSNETSAGAIAAQIAHGALLGARGNSGVILSQVLRGLAQGLENKATFAACDLAEALHIACDLAYRAVLKPVEGTILTVVRETAEAAKRSTCDGDNLDNLIQAMTVAAHEAVAHTPDLLPILKQAHVVDAGGQGFYCIIAGISRYVQSRSNNPCVSYTPMTLDATSLSDLPIKKGQVTIEEEYGYEVVFLLRDAALDIESIRQTIIDMGGVSTVVAGDERMLKIHTHTPWPGKILDYGVSLGSLADINIENLQEQSLAYAAESAREKIPSGQLGKNVDDVKILSPSCQIATIAVVAGAGFQKVFEGLGVSTVVPGGQTMNPSTEELLVAVNAVPARQVILLPNNSNVILSAQQVAGLTDKEVAIVPTETMPQGITALLSFNFEASFTANCKTMTEAAKSIQTAEITTAVRSVHFGNVHVREGDTIGLLNGNLVVAGQKHEQALHDTLQRMNIDRYEIVTLYYGAEVRLQAAEQIAQSIKEQYPRLAIEVVDGGQPYYAYILSAE